MIENGPVWGDRAAADLGLSAAQWWDAVGQRDWFRFDLPGRAGWRVTENGRKHIQPKENDRG